MGKIIEYGIKEQNDKWIALDIPLTYPVTISARPRQLQGHDGWSTAPKVVTINGDTTNVQIDGTNFSIQHYNNNNGTCSLQTKSTRNASNVFYYDWVVNGKSLYNYYYDGHRYDKGIGNWDVVDVATKPNHFKINNHPVKQLKIDGKTLTLQRATASWKMPQDSNFKYYLKDHVSGSVLNNFNLELSRNIINLVRQSLNGTIGSGNLPNYDAAFYYYTSDKKQPDGTLYMPEFVPTINNLNQINWDKVQEIKFRVRGGQYGLALDAGSQDATTSIISIKKEGDKFFFKVYEITGGSGGTSSIGTDWTEIPLGTDFLIMTMLTNRNAKLYARIKFSGMLLFGISGNSSAVNIRAVIDSTEVVYYT